MDDNFHVYQSLGMLEKPLGLLTLVFFSEPTSIVLSLFYVYSGSGNVSIYFQDAFYLTHVIIHTYERHGLFIVCICCVVARSLQECLALVFIFL